MNQREDTSRDQQPDKTPPGLAGQDPAALIPASAARAIIATLDLFEQFFRHHASAAVHAELRVFCAEQGWHPVCGAQALLDDLGWHTLPLQRALGTITEHGHPSPSGIVCRTRPLYAHTHDRSHDRAG